MAHGDRVDTMERDGGSFRFMSAEEMADVFGNDALTAGEKSAWELRRKYVTCDESRPVGFDRNGSEFGLMLVGPDGPATAEEVHTVKNGVWHHQTLMNRHKVRDSQPSDKLEWVDFSVSPPQPVEHTFTAEGQAILAKLEQEITVRSAQVASSREFGARIAARM